VTSVDTATVCTWSRPQGAFQKLQCTTASSSVDWWLLCRAAKSSSRGTLAEDKVRGKWL